jgi:hypothetical protein
MITDRRLQDLVDDFVLKVTMLARETAVATLNAQLSAGAESAPQRSAQHMAQTVIRESTRRPKKGAKRPAADIARLEGVLAKHIEKHPGQRVEQLNTVLGTKTRDVRLPLARLVEAGAVKTKGSRRATQYFPA